MYILRFSFLHYSVRTTKSTRIFSFLFITTTGFSFMSWLLCRVSFDFQIPKPFLSLKEILFYALVLWAKCSRLNSFHWKKNKLTPIQAYFSILPGSKLIHSLNMWYILPLFP